MLEVEARDGVGQPVVLTSDLVVNLAATSLTFFDNATCSGAGRANLTMTTGQSRIGFYFRAPATEGSYLVSASAPGVTAAQQSETVLARPDALSFRTTPSSQLRAGECVQATIGALRGGVDFAVGADTPVQLAVSLPGALRFFADAQCSLPLPSDVVTIRTGSATADFWVVPVIGARSHVLTAQAAPGLTVTQAWTPRPIVRRGPCNLLTGVTSTACTIPNALQPRDTAATLLLTQGTTTGNSPGDGEVVCRLATGGSRVNCQRATSNADAQLHYQVIEIPRGFQVQSAFSSTSCPAYPLTPVDPAQTFVIKTVGDGDTLFGGRDCTMYALTTATDLTSSGQCATSAAQVAQWTGVSVTRGDVTGGLPLNTASVTQSGLPATSSPNVIVLAQASSGGLSSLACDHFVRGQVTSPTSVSVSRGSNCTGVALQASFERIDFGSRATVQSVPAQLTGVTSVDLPIAPVDASRTFVLTSSQSVGGQGSAEHTSGQYAAGLVTTELLANPDGGYLSDVVTVRRGPSAGTASVTVYVVQVEP